ncbi:hypothetical protein CPB85DRAFT_1282462 [Mucidula mucida]|nr:hypothetical protein CPB85DRAFT_1282462 [Mucidula mucida]
MNSFKSCVSLLFGASLFALVASAPFEDLEARVLPSGHPVIDNDFLSKYGLITSGYVVETAIYPSGFSIPTETITALPSGYSVAWNGVFDPEGKTVSFFPESVLEPVVLQEDTSTESQPGAPSNTATSSAASSTASAASSSDSNGVGMLKPSFGLALVAVVMSLFM